MYAIIKVQKGEENKTSPLNIKILIRGAYYEKTD